MSKNEIRVSEIFSSLQGEGNTMGKPSVFLRLQSCNLMCGGKGTEKDKQLHDGATWRCDTIEVWLEGEKWDGRSLTKYLKDTYRQHFDSGSQLVITGGEPMLQQDQLPGLIINLRDEFSYRFRVEIETNGTIGASGELCLHVDQFNVSPKLANSGMPKDRRIKYEVMEQLAFLCFQDKAIFKFVVTEEDDIKEIIEDYIQPFRIPSRKIWLMPGCSNREQFEETAPMVAKECQRHGFQFSSRLQINLWNQTTGV